MFPEIYYLLAILFFCFTTIGVASWLERNESRTHINYDPDVRN